MKLVPQTEFRIVAKKKFVGTRLELNFTLN